MDSAIEVEMAALIGGRAKRSFVINRRAAAGAPPKDYR
jgi:hypothetical protein